MVRMVGSLELHGAQVALDGVVHTRIGTFRRDHLPLADLSQAAREWLLRDFYDEMDRAAHLRVTAEVIWRCWALYCAGPPVRCLGRIDVAAAPSPCHERLHKVLVRPFYRFAKERAHQCGRRWPQRLDHLEAMSGSSLTFVAIDTESTGTDPHTARVVELGWCVFTDGVPGLAGRALFHPGGPIPPEASAVHGLTDAHVAKAPPFAAWPRLREMLLSQRLCGYNLLGYDGPLLAAEGRRAFGETYVVGGSSSAARGRE